MFRIDLKYGCIVCCDSITISNIYSIDINEEDKSIEFNDITNFVLANISDWSDIEECGFVPYDAYDCLKPFETLLIENGKLTYKKGDELNE